VARAFRGGRMAGRQMPPSSLKGGEKQTDEPPSSRRLAGTPKMSNAMPVIYMSAFTKAKGVLLSIGRALSG
jgi:hypothetical protein